ncbi:hypothetical protein [Campylobacter sp. RM16192]|uniref:hypothetical protein n=1 Tax=Campylobacter sp. RM16192 TaxID=1660080 RepID=UPI00145182E5|nr:hypothetical protein [Campylobacter sp. RM16192]QCD52128.1 putative membrane protein [Campylobacter sp. RM16192]
MGMIIFIPYLAFSTIVIVITVKYTQKIWIRGVVMVTLFLIPAYDIIITNILGACYCATAPKAFIKEINLDYKNSDFIDENGNEHRQISNVVFENGNKARISDVWLDNQTAIEKSQSMEFTISLNRALKKDETLILSVNGKEITFNSGDKEKKYTHTWKDNNIKQEDKEFEVSANIIETSVEYIFDNEAKYEHNEFANLNLLVA